MKQKIAMFGILMISLVLLVSIADAQVTSVDCNSGPYYISTSGTYVLDSNIAVPPGGGTCIVIMTDNVILDGQGYEIDGQNAADGSFGVLVMGGNHNNIKNIEIDYFSGVGSAGIYVISSSTNNVFEDITLFGNYIGMWSDTGSSSNNVTGSTIENSLYAGIHLDSISDNWIYQNNFKNSMAEEGNAKNAGSNNWDNEYWFGGNYWDDYDHESEGCYDDYNDYTGEPESDGICDSPHIFDSNQDNYPFTTENGWSLNRAPIMDTIGPQETTEGVELAFVVTARDPNSGDTLTYSANNLPEGAEFDEETQTFTWTPDYEQAGTYPNVEFTVTDNGTPTESDSELITITVADDDSAFTVHHVLPYYTTETYGSAATAKMILDFLNANPSRSQTELRDYGIAYNLPGNTGELDPVGMDAVLGHFDPYDAIITEPFDWYDSQPGGNPYQGYNFAAKSFDNGDHLTYIRDICHWMDYAAPQWYGDPEAPLADPARVPPAIPIFGDMMGYDNWVVVNGFASSDDPLPDDNNPFYTPDFDVYGFWITDPNLGEELGANKYITVDVALADYLKPLSTSDLYNGKYVQVSEPPEVESTAHVTIVSVEITEENQRLVNDLNLRTDYDKNSNVLMKTTMEVSEVVKPQIDWTKVIPEYLLADALFAEAFEGAEFGKQILVSREDGDYNIITFEKNIDSRIFTTVAIIVDSETGAFKEGTWTNDYTSDYTWMDEKLAIKKAMAQYVKMPKKSIPKKTIGVIESIWLINEIESEFMWEPGMITNSPFQPYWKITIDGYVFYVQNDGTVSPTYGTEHIENIPEIGLF